MAKKRFKPITKRVNLIIIISLVLGISILISGYFIVFLITIDYSIENSLRQQSDILYKTIEKLMLTGQAPDAVDYFNDINLINPLYTIKLFRTSGSKAFTDNTTIETVNSNIGMQIFTPRTIEIEDREQPIQDYFIPAINLPPQTLLFQTKRLGQKYRLFGEILALNFSFLHNWYSAYDKSESISAFGLLNPDSSLHGEFRCV